MTLADNWLINLNCQRICVYAFQPTSSRHTNTNLSGRRTCCRECVGDETFSFVSLSKVEDSIKYSEFSAITSTIENWIGSRILRHFGNGISSDYYDEYVVLVLLSL